MKAGGNSPPSDTPWMRVSSDEVILEVTARPGASRRGVVGVSSDRLIVAVHARPDKGEANGELIEYLAREIRVPRSAIMIIRGETARRKTLRIITHQPAKAAARLLQMSKPK